MASRSGRSAEPWVVGAGVVGCGVVVTGPIPHHEGGSGVQVGPENAHAVKASARALELDGVRPAQRALPRACDDHARHGRRRPVAGGADGSTSPSLVTHRFALENIDEAFATAVAKPEGFVKAVVTMPDPLDPMTAPTSGAEPMTSTTSRAPDRGTAARRDDRATPSWAPPTRRPGATPTASSTSRCTPVMQVVVGRDAGARPRRPPSSFGWAEVGHRLARGRRARRHRPRRHLHAGQHPPRDRPRRARRGQARALREAAGQLGRRGRGDDRRRRGRASARGAYAMCGFTYRRVPALTLARELVAEGRLGTIRQVRAQYLQDWLSDADAPLTWRMDKSLAGSGALGDIGAHVIDATQWITGQSITGVSGAARDLRDEPSGRRARRPGSAAPATRRGSADRSTSTTPPGSPPASRAVPSASSRRPASRSAARTRSASRSTAPTARWPSTSRT